MRGVLRFLCFASLCVLIICLAGHGDIGFADPADLVGVAMPSEESLGKVPSGLRPVSGTAEPGGSGGISGGDKPPCFSAHEQIPDQPAGSANRQPDAAQGDFDGPEPPAGAGGNSRVGLTITMTGKIEDEGLQKKGRSPCELRPW